MALSLSAWYQKLIILLQFFTNNCQCIFNPSISVWQRMVSLAFFSFDMTEEHDNQFHAFVSKMLLVLLASVQTVLLRQLCVKL